MSDPIANLTAALADRYRIERELGVGGMATVYLAHDVKHDRKVAVKVLRHDLAESIGADRFLSEIRTTANLQHPHILALHDSGNADGVLYYVMPFVDGETLRDRLSREQQLPLSDTVAIVRDVADALDYAHRAGIVHRDIKPENILLSNGHAIVADFGIARAVMQPETHNLTLAGQIIGTPAYLSPEQITGAAIDGRSDLYSLGCVLYECLTGDLPFAGDAMAMLAQRFTGAPPSVRTRRRDALPHLDHVVQTAMATESTSRFDSGKAFIAALLAHVSAPVKSDKRAIVVLPFTNQSADPENEYFSDGLAEEISTDLASIKALRVISRTSAMRFKGSEKDIPSIGRELGVRYVLEGSVRKAGAALRITARLVDADSDEQVWSDKYSGTIDDVFEVQERVSREIVKALGVTLSSDEDSRLSQRAISNARAYELFLLARQEMRRLGTAVARGQALLEQAIAIEGECAPLLGLKLWGKLALLKSGLGDADMLREVTADSQALISKFPDEAGGYAALGYAMVEQGDSVAAIENFRKALIRDPYDLGSSFFLSISYTFCELFALNAETCERMVAMDPLSPASWMATGAGLWFQGRVAEAKVPLQRAIELDPQDYMARWSFGYFCAFVGDVAAADAEVQWLVNVGPQVPYTIQLQSLVLAVAGQSEQAIALVTALDMNAFDGHLTFHFAEVLAVAGATDLALDLLEISVAKGFTSSAFIREYCPFLESLRSHSRFAHILERATAESESLRARIAALPV